MTKFKVVRQHNSWSCYACVAAMITGESLDSVIKFIGHDGSEKTDWSMHPEKRRGFTKAEINLYLATKCYSLGCVGANVSGQTAEITNDYRGIHVEIPFDIPAMILVKSTLFEDGYHCLYWDSEQAFDPYYEDHVDLKNYTLDEWWPVIKFNEHDLPERINKFQMQLDDVDFKECSLCAAKLGAPDLCESCLHNRHTINSLKESLFKTY